MISLAENAGKDPFEQEVAKHGDTLLAELTWFYSNGVRVTVKRERGKKRKFTIVFQEDK